MNRLTRTPRIQRWLASVIALAAALTALTAVDTSHDSGEASLVTVEDFGLFDHQGGFHRLHYYTDDPRTRAIVLFVQGNGCPLVRKRVPELNRLQSQYAASGVRFWMINANPQDTREELAEEAREFDIRLPILIDETQWVARSLKLDRTAEVLLIDPVSWRIRYRGAIDDRLDYETEQPKVTRRYLVAALDALLNDKPINEPVTRSPGCRITYESALGTDDNPAAYSEAIGPILLDKCIRCHRPGGIGPFALTSHRKVRGWAAMIREVVMTRRMPPWQADPHIGQFANDFSLSVEEQRRLLDWIERGALRGQGRDPLAEHESKEASWRLGPPDRVVDLKEQSVPAEGVIDYRYLTMESPFDHDVWVRAADLMPGNAKVLHHLIAYLVYDQEGEEKRKWLAVYAPGMEPEAYPTGTAILFRKQDRLLFELHYTPYGKAVIDRSRLALYLTDVPRPIHLRTGIFLDEEFVIPAGARAHPHRQERAVNRDIILFSLFPHMHFRGKSMRFEVRYPDGGRKLLLSVPYYNFNWQRAYFLSEPERIPKGSTLALEAQWDNSALNKANPDTTREVTWGEQSSDEMFFATYRFVPAREWDKRAKDRQ